MRIHLGILATNYAVPPLSEKSARAVVSFFQIRRQRKLRRIKITFEQREFVSETRSGGQICCEPFLRFRRRGGA